MKLTKCFWILIFGIIFITPSLFAFGACQPCNIDNDCSLGFVCRANCCAVEKGISITITVPGVPTPPPPVGGVPVVPATVIFEGKAYPGALVTIARNKSVTGTTAADFFGNFSKTLTGVPAGTWTFNIYAEDTEGRKSVTLGFTISIAGGTTTEISGIFIPPTISLSKEIIRRGATLEIFGQAYPESEVQIFISSPIPEIKKTKSTEKGKWKYSLDTTPLIVGTYTTKAKAVTPEGEQSPFSEEMIFKITEFCKGADLNFDGKVNIIDFSILLYFWGQKSPANRCADINSDGTVNIVDFSIMMYYWTG